MEDITRRLRRIRLLVLDFDGVLTDGHVLVDRDGVESVRCSHRDGQGIGDVRRAGLLVVVISGQQSSYVAARCQKMDIPFFYGIADKVRCLREYLVSLNSSISLDEVCFVGDDRGDLPLLRIVGVPCTVADGVTECHQLAVVVTQRKGGDHAVREICDLILAAKEVAS